MFEATIPLLFVGLHAVAYSGVVAWIFLDPYFYLGFEQLLLDIRVSPKPPFGDYGFHAFRNLGWRVLVAAILLLLAIVSGAVLIVWSIAHWHDAIRSGLICWVVIVASWLLLYGTHKQIYGAGTVRRVVAVAPFLGLGDFGVPEGGARRLARFLRGIGMGRSFVPGGGATSMLTTPFAANRLTSDPARHARGATLAWDCPQVAIGSPSIGWLAGAFDTMDRVFRPDALDRWRLPTLVFACGADRVVSNDAIERFDRVLACVEM